MTSAEASADGGGDRGAAVPLPPHWPGADGRSDRIRVRPEVLDWVAQDARRFRSGLAPAPGFFGTGGEQVRLAGELGRWPTAAGLLAVHGQYEELFSAFEAAAAGKLELLAQRLTASAAAYRRAEAGSAELIDVAAADISVGATLSPDVVPDAPRVPVRR